MAAKRRKAAPGDGYDSVKRLKCRVSHPFGVRPLGNIFTDVANFRDARSVGLGVLAVLEDENIFHILR